MVGLELNIQDLVRVWAWGSTPVPFHLCNASLPPPPTSPGPDVHLSVSLPPKTTFSAGPRVQLPHLLPLSFSFFFFFFRCLYLSSCVLSVQNECSHGLMWGAVYVALIASSSDLCEAHLLVSVTGWPKGCASLVFDLCLCAEGRGSSFYRTTVALVPGVKAKFRTDWVALGKLPNHPESFLAHLCNGAGHVALEFLGGFQWDDQAQLWGEVWYTVVAHYPVLTAALDVMFPALYLANSWLSYILELPSHLCQNASFERPSSLLLLLCDNLILPWSHWSKKRPSFDI